MKVLIILKGSKGITLLEILIVVSIMLFITAGTYSFFINQDQVFSGQRDLVDVQRKIQLAVDVMRKEIRQAGAGLPQGSTKIVTANANEFSFYGDIHNKNTTLSSAASASASSVTLNVTSSSGFQANDTIYIVEFTGTTTIVTKSETRTVSAVGNNTLTVSALTNSYSLGSRVFRRGTVTYALSGSSFNRTYQVGSQTVAQTLVDNVTGLTFTYDSPTTSSIREVTVSITARTSKVSPDTGQYRSVTVSSTIAPRNLPM